MIKNELINFIKEEQSSIKENIDSLKYKFKVNPSDQDIIDILKEHYEVLSKIRSNINKYF